MRENSSIHSNFRATEELSSYLQQWGIVALEGLDTRALVRRIRRDGAMKGVLSTKDLDHDSLVAKAKASPGLVGRDLVCEVMPSETTCWKESLSSWSSLEEIGPRTGPVDGQEGWAHVVALDYGMKWNILRHLVSRGFRVTVMPGSASAAEILAQDPDGVFLSNGPGDPEPLTGAVQTIRDLLGKKPIFGICLGHQLLSLACGAKTFKLRFGHRGANQPVQNLENGSVEITSQNHGFAVCEEDLPAELEVTHRNLNDGTIEGLGHRQLPVYSVQYHPEASAGPHDSQYLFDRFSELVRS